jgi:hypothetical protein
MRGYRADGGPVVTTQEGRGTLTLPSGRVYPAQRGVRVETKHYYALVPTEGYVSGVAAGSFVDKATGATDLGFGLSIVDFLLEPTDPKAPVPEGQYHFGDKLHGNIPKRYVEGPQICTQARKLPAVVSRGPDFVAIQLRYQWNQSYPPRDKAGSVWEQTLIFPDNERFFLSSDRVTTVSSSPELFFRVDMPGHLKHKEGKGFEHVYLSYHQPTHLIPSEFLHDFAPDEKFLYQRGKSPRPERFIRGYQVTLGKDAKPGPWLVGMTLNVDDVYQAWCHQRGYVCMIEELGGRPTQPGDTFGAAYLIGWFDDISSMNAAYDRFKGASGLELVGPAGAPTAYRTLKSNELKSVTGPSRS